MENDQSNQAEAVNKIYDFAARLMVHENKNSIEVQNALIEKGLSESAALTIVTQLEDQIKDAKKSRARKDMLYGALWCIGGTVATLAHIGFIFWGAIIFGAIQFFKGLANFFSAD